jgi:hypothetical protein
MLTRLITQTSHNLFQAVSDRIEAKKKHISHITTCLRICKVGASKFCSQDRSFHSDHVTICEKQMMTDKKRCEILIKITLTH